MEPGQIGADVQVLVRVEIERTPHLATIKEKLLAKCAENAGGMFLWARLMLDAVKAAPNIKAQLGILERFPLGLDSMYAQFIVKTGRGLDSVHLSSAESFSP